jgi:hypothetical protein
VLSKGTFGPFHIKIEGPSSKLQGLPSLCRFKVDIPHHLGSCYNTSVLHHHVKPRKARELCANGTSDLRFMNKNPGKKTRHLVLVLGDQLDRGSSAFDGFDPAADVVWMAEVPEESTHVWSHKARITIFLSAMRHFRNALQKEGLTVHYRLLDHPKNRGSLSAELAEAVRKLRPEGLISVVPGEWRVGQALKQTAEAMNMGLDIRPDRHFLSSPEDFSQYAAERKQLRMEFFYRQARKRLGCLMEGDKPTGGGGILTQIIDSASASAAQENCQLLDLFRPMPSRVRSWPPWKKASQITQGV